SPQLGKPTGPRGRHPEVDVEVAPRHELHAVAPGEVRLAVSLEYGQDVVSRQESVGFLAEVLVLFLDIDGDRHRLLMRENDPATTPNRLAQSLPSFVDCALRIHSSSTLPWSDGSSKYR